MSDVKSSTNTAQAAPAPKTKLMAFSDEQKHVGKLFSFNDAQMADAFGTPDTSSTDTGMPPTDTTSDMGMTATDPVKDKTDSIKAAISGEAVDKSVKSEGEKLIARLEECSKVFSDVDAFIAKNSAPPAAPAPESTAPAAVTPAA